MTNFEKVREFHKAFGLPALETPQEPKENRTHLRLSLIEEELLELYEAIPALANPNLVDVADALTDLLYVVYGMGLEFGIDLDKCFEEVHNSNMSKLGSDGKPIHREDGKVMKGPNFRAPDLKKVLFV